MTGSPEAPSGPAGATPLYELDGALVSLRRNAAAWRAVRTEERVRLLEACRTAMRDVADRWVRTSLEGKGLSAGGPGEGEEWLVLALVLRALRVLAGTLEETAREGRPELPGPPESGPGGRAVVPAHPRSLEDRILFPGIRGRVWTRPGTGPEEIRARWRPGSGGGDVALVLGAGNIGSLPVTDVLHQMFARDRAVLLKLSPVNDYLAPLLEEGLAPLLHEGFLRLARGGAPVGRYLTTHPGVGAVHLTGSDRTYEKIVFGDGEAGRRRREEGRPLLQKPVTAELGNVTPVIVVPGPWSDGDLRGQARQLASWLVANAGFNCLTPRVLVQWRGWERRDAFLDALEDALRGLETRPAYYPGAGERHAAYLEAHPEATRIGSGRGERLPWTLIRDVDPNADDEPCFRREAFCGLMCETALAAPDPETFVRRSAAFVNDRLWGTLTCALLVHPTARRDAGLGAAVDEAIAGLRYGSVCVNLRSEYAYFLTTTPWGAYPGATAGDIQSGTGHVNNFLRVPDPEKTVLRGPFRRRPDPFAATSPRFPEVGRRFAAYEGAPSVSRLVRLAWTALRS